MNFYHKLLDLPESETPPDHYGLLGVPRFTDDAKQIHAALVTRSTQLRGWDISKFYREANALLDEVVASASILEDPIKKAAYDAELRKRLGLPADKPVAVVAQPEAVEGQPAIAPPTKRIESSPAERSARPAKQPEASRVERDEEPTDAVADAPETNFDSLFLKLGGALIALTLLIAVPVLMNSGRKTSPVPTPIQTVENAGTLETPNSVADSDLDQVKVREQFTLSGHAGVVNSVAFSPDGHRLASASTDRTVKLWDTSTGQVIRSLNGHAGDVMCVCFSQDGQRLASASRDKTIKTWDANTGDELLTLKGHTGGVLGVAFGSGGQRIASASTDRTVKVWDATTGQDLFTLKGHNGTVQSVAFNPDGQRLASASWDAVKMWEVHSGQESLTLNGQTPNTMSVEFSPDGDRLASAGLDGTVNLWDARTGMKSHTHKPHSHGIMGVAFNSDGDWMASGGWDQSVRVWNATTGQASLTLKVHPLEGTTKPSLQEVSEIREVGRADDSLPITSVAFSPDGKRLAVASADRTIRLWEVDRTEANGGAIANLGKPTSEPSLSASSPPPLPAVAPFDMAQAKQYQADWAKHLGSPVTFDNSIGMTLVCIPAGEFDMGAPETEQGARSKEKPQHRVRITQPFYVGKYEVTQGEYEQIMGKNPSYFSPSGRGKASVTGTDTRRFPVESVSWDEAQEFCRRLSALPEEQTAGRTYRLPTEAEWEYACRAGTTTPFHFGGVSNGREANFNGTSPYGTTIKGPNLQRTTKVGSYPPNAFDLCDLHGNVCEWCQDFYDEKYYAQRVEGDPQGPFSGNYRVPRGGIWNSTASGGRSAWRGNVSPEDRFYYTGFRVVCESSVRTPTSSHVTTTNNGTLKPAPATPPVTASEPPLASAPFDADQAKQHQAAWAKHLGSPVTFDNSIGMTLVCIPAGEFDMGAPETEQDAQPGEKPQHRVRITRPFYVGKSEVTQGEYEQIMGKNPSYFSPSGRGKASVTGTDTRRFPVESVSWVDAQEFCRRLSELPAEKTAGRTYRLPTEAEWEYACRAGTTTPFHFGSRNNGWVANVDGNHPYGTTTKGPNLQRTTKVGSYPPNAFDLCDMHGNVSEWCQDFYGGKYYAQRVESDPQGPSSGNLRVLRGGSWDNFSMNARSALRTWLTPDFRTTLNGFRVVFSAAAVRTP